MYHYRYSTLLSISIALALIGPAYAETDLLCGQERAPEDFVGAYTVKIGNALLKGGDRKIGLKGSETFPAIMSLIDGQLVLEAGPTSILFTIAGEDEPDWQFEPIGDLQMDSADFEVLMACSISELPRLIGAGTSSSMEGDPIEFTYRLIAYTITEGEGVRDLVGSLKWSGGGIAASRVVLMSRD